MDPHTIDLKGMWLILRRLSSSVISLILYLVVINQVKIDIYIIVWVRDSVSINA